MLYFSFMSPAPELNTGNIVLTETTSEAYWQRDMHKILLNHQSFWNNLLNPLRPRQNGCHYPDDIFKCIFLNKNVWILREILQKFAPKVWINNIPSLVQIMAWRRPGDKPLSEPMMVSLLMHICVSRPQWVKTVIKCSCPGSKWSAISSFH